MTNRIDKLSLAHAEATAIIVAKLRRVDGFDDTVIGKFIVLMAEHEQIMLSVIGAQASQED